MRKIIAIIILLLVISLVAVGSEIFFGKGIPFAYREKQWEIGIFSGTTPFNLSAPKNIKNPILTAKDITDVKAYFVADPFMIYKGSSWYLFFEVLNRSTGQGDIGLAISENGINWTYKGIVLDEPFHLSYPYVFKWQDGYYMIPESCEADSVRLYKAIDFPSRWQFVKVLIEGKPYVDPSLFRFGGKWWLFCSDPNNNMLYLFYSDDLFNNWKEHSKSPVIKDDANICRPGGRVLVFEGKIFRIAQDDEPYYQNQVRVFEITELTTSTYKEKELSQSPVLKGGDASWDKFGMHQLDAHRIDKDKWIACVDGFGKYFWFFKGQDILNKISAFFKR